jgi:hypothetical protein
MVLRKVIFPGNNMRNRIAASVAVLLFGVIAFAYQKNIDALKDEVDRSHGGHRAKLALETADQLIGVADGQFTAGENAQAQAAVEEVVKYTQIARDASFDDRGSMKQTEIRLRQIARRMEGLKRTLAVEDRGPLDAAEKKIEQFRQDLLDAMFSPKKKEKS